MRWCHIWSGEKTDSRPGLSQVRCSHTRADPRFVPGQWETALLCNDISHWLGTSLESALHTHSTKLAFTLQARHPGLFAGAVNRTEMVGPISGRRHNISGEKCEQGWDGAAVPGTQVVDRVGSGKFLLHQNGCWSCEYVGYAPPEPASQPFVWWCTYSSWWEMLLSGGVPFES